MTPSRWGWSLAVETVCGCDSMETLLAARLYTLWRIIYSSLHTLKNADFWHVTKTHDGNVQTFATHTHTHRRVSTLQQLSSCWTPHPRWVLWTHRGEGGRQVYKQSWCQESGVITKRRQKGHSRARVVLILGHYASYKAELTLWKFSKLYVDGLCSFLHMIAHFDKKERKRNLREQRREGKEKVGE
jgi:hypothetical protein